MVVQIKKKVNIYIKKKGSKNHSFISYTSLIVIKTKSGDTRRLLFLSPHTFLFLKPPLPLFCDIFKHLFSYYSSCKSLSPFEGQLYLFLEDTYLRIVIFFREIINKYIFLSFITKNDLFQEKGREVKDRLNKQGFKVISSYKVHPNKSKYMQNKILKRVIGLIIVLNSIKSSHTSHLGKK